MKKKWFHKEHPVKSNACLNQGFIFSSNPFLKSLKCTAEQLHGTETWCYEDNVCMTRVCLGCSNMRADAAFGS